MPVTQDVDAQLDRAYVQSKVIKTNLDHLTDTVQRVAPGLSHDLAALARRFDAYVHELGVASSKRSGSRV